MNEARGVRAAPSEGGPELGGPAVDEALGWRERTALRPFIFLSHEGHSILLG